LQAPHTSQPAPSPNTHALSQLSSPARSFRLKQGSRGRNEVWAAHPAGGGGMSARAFDGALGPFLALQRNEKDD